MKYRVSFIIDSPTPDEVLRGKLILLLRKSRVRFDQLSLIPFGTYECPFCKIEFEWHGKPNGVCCRECGADLTVLAEQVGLCDQYDPTQIMPFGTEHRGKHMDDVPGKYLDWAVGEPWIKKYPSVVAYVKANRSRIDSELD